MRKEGQREGVRSCLRRCRMCHSYYHHQGEVGEQGEFKCTRCTRKEEQTSEELKHLSGQEEVKREESHWFWDDSKRVKMEQVEVGGGKCWGEVMTEAEFRDASAGGLVIGLEEVEVGLVEGEVAVVVEETKKELGEGEVQKVYGEAVEVEEKPEGAFGEEKVEGEVIISMVDGEAVVTLEEMVEC